MRLSRRRFVSMSAAALVLGSTGHASAQLRRMTIGTTPPGTECHGVGTGLARLFSEKLGMQSVVQPYAGPSVYLPLIQDGEVTMALSSSLDSGGAYRGEDARTPMTKLRALARLWSRPYGYVARRDSGMRSVADLRGKRVAIEIGANASLTRVNLAMLAAAGLSEGEITPVTLDQLPQGLRAVMEGKVDAAPVAAGIAATRDANAIPDEMRYLDLAGPNANDAFLSERMPGVFTYALSSPGRADATQPLTVAAFDIFLVVNTDLSGREVDRILAALRDNFAALQKDQPPLRRGEAAKLGASSNTVPYHPAAIAFFRANDLWTPANDAREQQIMHR